MIFKKGDKVSFRKDSWSWRWADGKDVIYDMENPMTEGSFMGRDEDGLFLSFRYRDVSIDQLIPLTKSHLPEWF